MSSKPKWFPGEGVPEKTQMLGLRLCRTESERVEELRRILRLRSNAEVVRLAFHLLECVCAGEQIEACSPDELLLRAEST